MSNIVYQQFNFDRERRTSYRTTKPSIHVNMRLNVPMSRIGKGEMKETEQRHLKLVY